MSSGSEKKSRVSRDMDTITWRSIDSNSNAELIHWNHWQRTNTTVSHAKDTPTQHIRHEPGCWSGEFLMLLPVLAPFPPPLWTPTPSVSTSWELSWVSRRWTLLTLNIALLCVISVVLSFYCASHGNNISGTSCVTVGHRWRSCVLLVRLYNHDSLMIMAWCNHILAFGNWWFLFLSLFAFVGCTLRFGFCCLRLGCTCTCLCILCVW